MRKIEKKEFESQFDKRFYKNELEFYKTLQINDIVRLMDAYDKSISCETKKAIIEKYFSQTISVTTQKQFQIIGKGLLLLQVIESKGEKKLKTISKRGLDNRVRLREVKDKDAIWKAMVENSGYDWRLHVEVKDEFGYYEAQPTAELASEIRDKSKNGKTYLTAPIQWQTA